MLIYYYYLVKLVLLNLSYPNFVQGWSFANIWVLLAELSCLTPIVACSKGFCDVLEGNVQNIQKRGKMVILGVGSSGLEIIKKGGGGGWINYEHVLTN